MGKFYVRCEVITGYPSGESRENVNEIHSQSFDKLQEHSFEAKDVILSLYKTACCAVVTTVAMLAVGMLLAPIPMRVVSFRVRLASLHNAEQFQTRNTNGGNQL